MRASPFSGLRLRDMRRSFVRWSRPKTRPTTTSTLAKLKDDVQKKRRLPPFRPPEPEGLRGREGSLEEGGPAKVYIPMIDQERTRETPQNGDHPIKKKG